MGKMSRHKSWEPFGPGASNSHPAQTGTNDERNEEYLGQLWQVLSNRMLNEVKGGYSHFGFRNELLTEWSKHWQAPRVTNGHPRITLTGFTIAGNANYPRHRDQRVVRARRLQYAFDARAPRPEGGFEFVRHYEDSENCNRCGGEIDARNFNVSTTPNAAGAPCTDVSRPVQRRPVEPESARRISAATRSASARSRPASAQGRCGCRTTGASAIASP